MNKVSLVELENNLDKYIELAKTQEIEVISSGKTIFRMVPNQNNLLHEWDNLFGSLPKDALTDDEIERE